MKKNKKYGNEEFKIKKICIINQNKTSVLLKNNYSKR